MLLGMMCIVLLKTRSDICNLIHIMVKAKVST